MKRKHADRTSRTLLFLARGTFSRALAITHFGAQGRHKSLGVAEHAVGLQVLPSHCHSKSDQPASSQDPVQLPAQHRLAERERHIHCTNDQLQQRIDLSGASLWNADASGLLHRGPPHYRRSAGVQHPANSTACPLHNTFNFSWSSIVGGV